MQFVRYGLEKTVDSNSVYIDEKRKQMAAIQKSAFGRLESQLERESENVSHLMQDIKLLQESEAKLKAEVAILQNILIEALKA